MEELLYNMKVYLSCEPGRKEELLQKLLASDRKMLLDILSLPSDSEERFRIYDLLIRIAPDGNELLNHVFAECEDDSDPLSQLAAIQFVNEHNLQNIDHFINLFNKNLDDPLKLPSIATTLTQMIMKQPDPLQYSDIVEVLITKSLQDNELLGSLTPLTKNEVFAQMMLSLPEFQMFLMDVPHSFEFRAFTLYMRNLLVKYMDNPSQYLLGATSMVSAITNPTPALRVAAFDHITFFAPYCRAELLQVPRIRERLRDPSMDSSIEEAKSRNRAIDALGLYTVDPMDPTKKITPSEDMGPDLMVI